MCKSLDIKSSATCSRHIFLTGQSGIGKTTLIQSIVTSLPDNISVGGFTTRFNIQSDKEKTLYISPFTVKNLNEKKTVMQWNSGSITIFDDIFESYGAELLQNSQNKNLIIMDELGRFEENCKHFKSEVFTCLDGKIPVLGVIRSLDYKTWLDEVKSHPNVMVLEVSKENIDVIEKKMKQIFVHCTMDDAKTHK